MKLLMKIVKSSLNEIDVFGTRQETRAIVGIMWKSTTPSGVKVTGYKEPKVTVYPLMK